MLIEIVSGVSQGLMLIHVDRVVSCNFMISHAPTGHARSEPLVSLCLKLRQVHQERAWSIPVPVASAGRQDFICSLPVPDALTVNMEWQCPAPASAVSQSLPLWHVHREANLEHHHVSGTGTEEGIGRAHSLLHEARGVTLITTASDACA